MYIYSIFCMLFFVGYGCQDASNTPSSTNSKRDTFVLDTTKKSSSDNLSDSNQKKLHLTMPEYPNDETGALKIATQLNSNTADAGRIYRSLLPDEPDCQSITKKEGFGVMLHEYAYPTYRKALYMKGKAGETQINIYTLTSEDIASGKLKDFDVSYGLLKDKLKPNITFYAFSYSTPDNNSVSRFDALIYTGQRWIFIPHPGKAFEQR